MSVENAIIIIYAYALIVIGMITVCIFMGALIGYCMLGCWDSCWNSVMSQEQNNIPGPAIYNLQSIHSTLPISSESSVEKSEWKALE